MRKVHDEKSYLIQTFKTTNAKQNDTRSSRSTCARLVPPLAYVTFDTAKRKPRTVYWIVFRPSCSASTVGAEKIFFAKNGSMRKPFPISHFNIVFRFAVQTSACTFRIRYKLYDGKHSPQPSTLSRSVSYEKVEKNLDLIGRFQIRIYAVGRNE